LFSTLDPAPRSIVNSMLNCLLIFAGAVLTTGSTQLVISEIAAFL